MFTCFVDKKYRDCTSILYVGSKNSIVHGDTLDKMPISFNGKNEVMTLNNTDKTSLVVLIEASL